MASLPPFLHAFSLTQHSVNLPCQNAQFLHSGRLGASHALWWPAHESAQDPDKVLLFIPGNPGLVDFYVPFLSGIHAKHASSNLAIVAHAHLDHFPGIENKPETRYAPGESLTIQLESSLEVLDAIISCFPKSTRIVAIGHSVGAWIALQMLKARPHAITASFFLFPTLSNIADTPNGKLLAPIFSPFSRYILSSLSFLIRYLPERFFAKLFSSWPEHQLMILRHFLHSPTSIVASLAMAHEEMKMIRDIDMEFIEQHKHKLRFYYAEQDDWIGHEKHAFLCVFDPKTQSAHVTHGPIDVPHAFCINHGELLSKECHKWLIELEENQLQVACM